MHPIVSTYVICLIIIVFIGLITAMIIEFKRNSIIINDTIANNTIILNYKFKRSKDTKSIKYKDMTISKVDGILSLLFPYVVDNKGYIQRNSRIKKHLDLIFKYGEI